MGLVRSGFVKDVFSLTIGTAVAQVVPIAVSPLITRLYSPSDLGLFALYLGISGMIAVVATARYEVAVMLPEDDADALNLSVLALMIAVAVSLLTLLGVFLFEDLIVQVVNNAQIRGWLYLVPLTVLFTGCFQTFTFWLNRNKGYTRISAVRITQAFSISGIQLTAHKILSNGMIAGNVIGQGVASVLAGVMFRKSVVAAGVGAQNVSGSHMKRMAIKYKDFPMVNSLHAFSDIARDSIAIIIISFYFDSEIVGYYGLTLRLLKTPVWFVGNAIGQVFFKQSTEYARDGILFTRMKQLLIRLVVIGLPLFVLVYFLSEPFFGMVFGKEWTESGTYTMILTPLFFLNFVASPLSVVPLVLDKQKVNFALALSRSVIFVAVFLVCGWYGLNMLDTLMFLSIAVSAFLIVMIGWFFSIARNK